MSSLYTPLLEGQIRLMRVLPGRHEEDIRCQLEVHHLGTVSEPYKYGCPAYEAISYVWGDASDVRKIFVNNTPLWITANLFDALRTFRRANESRVVWADAVCINQQDLDERAVQVTLMASIFSVCSACNIWLGEVDGYEEKLVSPAPIPDVKDPEIATHNAAVLKTDYVRRAPEIEKMADLLRFLVESDTDSEYPLYEREYRGFRSPEEVNNPYFRAITSLLHILCRPWWYRTWTIQEVVLPCRSSREVTIFVGSGFFDFDMLLRAADGWFDGAKQRLLDCSSHSAFIELCNALSCAISLVRKIRFILDPELSPIQCAWGHLEVLTGRTSTDPRDAIYGLSGLFSQSLTSTGPDYTSAISACYSHAMKEFIAHTGSLDYLQIINPVLDWEIQRPSWVIDFSKGTKGNASRPNSTWERGPYIMTNTGPFYDVLKVRSTILTDVREVIPAHNEIEIDQSIDPQLMILSEWYKAAARRGVRYSNLLDAISGSLERGFRNEIEDRMTDIDRCDISGVADPFTTFDPYTGDKYGLESWSRNGRLVFWAFFFKDRYNTLVNERLALIILRDGRIGTAYECTRPGDSLAIFQGAKAPVILRPADEGRTLESGYQSSARSYHFLGSCHVSKPLSTREESELHWRDIDLV